jgi:predicted nucleotidyltransferase
MDIKALRSHKKKILSIARQYCAENVRVFGSVVRGEAKAGSDIDLLVTFLPGASLLDQAGLIDDLGEALNTKVDVVSDRALNPYLRSKILKEAAPL